MERPLFRAALLPLALAFSGCSSRGVFTLYHTGSMHGSVGGFAALAKVVNGSGHRLLVDSGNWYEGTPEGMLSKGESVVRLMNEVGYDAAAVGNQEFVFGQENLKKLAGAAKFAALGSNIYKVEGDERPDYLKAGLVKDVGGVKVGLFSLVTPRLPLMTNPKNVDGLRVRSPMEEAKARIEDLRKQGAEVVVALSRVGWERPDDDQPFEGDRFLADNLPGLDVLVGGRCPEEQPDGYRSEATGALYVCTSGDLKEVGVVELEYDGGAGRLVRADNKRVPLDAARTGEDPAIKKLVEAEVAKADAEMSAALTTAGAALKPERWAESPLGDWVADCMRSQAKSELAFINSGALRAGLPAGKVTRRDVFQLMPFEDNLYVLKLTGRQIRDALEEGLSGGFGVLQVSGLKVSYDPKSAPGRRVTQVAGGGGPLAEAKQYSVAVNEFLASGGDGLSVLTTAAKMEDKGTRLRDVLEACAKKESPLKAPKAGRLSAKR